MRQRAWFVWRAVLAIALMVGFYLLAFVIAAALVYTAYALFDITDAFWLYTASAKVIAFCCVAALTVIWAILPRPDAFTPPGPLLTPADQPRLFSVLNTVAQATGQKMPREVYAIDEANAWVASRGGIMGFGSRRVMGIGLPLLQALSVDQFRATLAHEFGHYHGGDVVLGPWTLQTRSAMRRTIESLGKRWLTRLFEWYALLFMRTTQAISRRQELLADQLAANLVGARVRGESLVRGHLAAAAHLHFMLGDLLPVLSAGFLPPVTAGFGMFLRSPAMQSRVGRFDDADIPPQRTSPFDSHPTLHERLAAIGLQTPPAGEVDTPAITLLDEIERLERLLVDGKPDPMRPLQPIAWSDVCRQVQLPGWTELVASSAHALAPFSPTAPPSGHEAFLRFGSRLLSPAEDAASVDADAAVSYAVHVFGAALCVAANAAGFELRSAPGTTVCAARNGESFEPFTVARRLSDGTLSADEWSHQCAGLRESAVTWSALAPSPPA